MVASEFDERILLITDSLSLPIPTVDYTSTYTHFLRNEFPNSEFIARSEGGKTTEDLRIDADQNPLHIICNGDYEQDAIITQLGIVDCAPRYSNSIERTFLFSSPSELIGLDKAYMSVMKKIRTPRPRRRYVHPGEFRENICHFYSIMRDNDIPVYVIAIRPSTPALDRKNPYASESIKLYNNIYRRVIKDYPNVDFLNPYENMARNNIGSGDGIHISKKSHKKIFEEISEKMPLKI